jgi:hypothetical protein
MKYIQFVNDVLLTRYDSDIHSTIPVDAVEVSDALFFQTIEEDDGEWFKTGDVIAKRPFTPIPETAETVRFKRDFLITQTDWTQGYDIPQVTKDLWIPYRQELRDITLQSGFPTSVTWPVKPA